MLFEVRAAGDVAIQIITTRRRQHAPIAIGAPPIEGIERRSRDHAHVGGRSADQLPGLPTPQHLLGPPSVHARRAVVDAYDGPVPVTDRDPVLAEGPERHGATWGVDLYHI